MGFKEQGLILKGIGGFYYVKTSDKIYECKARGLFRKNEVIPLAGDRVVIEVDENTEKGYIIEIKDRKNSFIRPPVANIDKLFLVVSATSPTPNLEVLDKLIAIAEYKDVEPIIVITKTDLCEYQHLVDVYKKAGFSVHTYSAVEKSDTSQILAELSGCITAFCGNSGVGKSSLLNGLFPELNLKTNIISEKLGRGKHTTREVMLYEVEGGYVADTPGFSSIDLERYEIIYKDKLQYCFRDFADYIENCKFTGCSHTKEKGCAVIEAVLNGEIATSRHASYIAMYESAKNLKEWEIKKSNEKMRNNF